MALNLKGVDKTRASNTHMTRLTQAAPDLGLVLGSPIPISHQCP